MRRHFVHGEPIVDDVAEGRPATPSFESSAPSESLGNAAAAARGSQDHERRRPETAARGKIRSKPKAVHWETLMRSRPWPDEPAE